MKQIIHLLVLASLSLAVFQSCLLGIEDSRNNYMVDDQLAIVYDDVVTPVSLYAGHHTLSVLKSGKGQVGAQVTIGASSAALQAFLASEEGEGLSLTEIPSSYYTLSGDRISFEAPDLCRTASLDWDPSALATLVDGDGYVVPVSILEGSIGVNDKHKTVILNFLKSTVGFASSGSSTLAKETPEENGEVSVKIKLDRSMPVDLVVRYAVDNTLIDAYNAEKGTSFVPAPAGYAVIPDGVTIPAGTSDVFSTVTLNTAALFAGGKMMDFRTLLIPLRITGTSVDGVNLSDQVYYFIVNNPLAGASFTRVWGRFSKSAVWSLEYGLPSGADRNLALDDEWVYLPYSVGGSTARITAISVQDPEVTRLVNCTGFTGATITTACVRVIDKGDGTRMLIASGAGENTFPFYAWENGIDNPPTVYALECTWRRGGDRIQFHGTWQDGVLYTHAYQGTFTTRYIVKNGQFVSTSRTLIDMPYTGFGGFYKYPGQDQMVFASSDDAAFVSLTGTTRKAGDGQDIYETSREPFAGASLSYGYNVFTYSGDSYIAYVAYDREDGLKEDGVTAYTTMQRARLVVVKDKGSFKASLDGDNKDIVFEAPIQGEEFTDLAVAPPVSSQGDCAVVVLRDKVLIAAGAQGLGISVFKME